MKLTKTELNQEYAGTQKLWACNLPIPFVAHFCNARNQIIIDDELTLDAYYTAIITKDNEKSLLTEKSHLLLHYIDKLYEMDFEDVDYINDKLQELKEIYPQIDTVNKLWELYEFLMDNKPSFYEFLENYSWDLNDYNDMGDHLEIIPC